MNDIHEAYLLTYLLPYLLNYSLTYLRQLSKNVLAVDFVSAVFYSLYVLKPHPYYCITELVYCSIPLREHYVMMLRNRSWHDSCHLFSSDHSNSTIVR